MTSQTGDPYQPPKALPCAKFSSTALSFSCLCHSALAGRRTANQENLPHHVKSLDMARANHVFLHASLSLSLSESQPDKESLSHAKQFGFVQILPYTFSIDLMAEAAKSPVDHRGRVSDVQQRPPSRLQKRAPPPLQLNHGKFAAEYKAPIPLLSPIISLSPKVKQWCTDAAQ